MFKKLKDIFTVKAPCEKELPYNLSCSYTETIPVFLERHAFQELNDRYEFENLPIFQSVNEAEQFTLANGGQVIPVRDFTKSETLAALKKLGIKHIERSGYSVIRLTGFDKKPILIGADLYSNINDKDIAATLLKAEVRIKVEYSPNEYMGLRIIGVAKLYYSSDIIFKLASNGKERYISSHDLQKYYRSA